jgi:hypothetical protein
MGAWDEDSEGEEWPSLEDIEGQIHEDDQEEEA